MDFVPVSLGARTFMKPVRVLVVDDSALARELIIAILSSDNGIRVVGEAADGMEALEKVHILKPELVTMDIEMPVMGGLETIERIMNSCAVPILVVTTKGDAHTAFTAMSKGALDLIEKPDVNLESAAEFIEKIKFLSKIKVIRHISGTFHKERQEPGVKSENLDKVVAIASSSGGPKALSILLSALPESFPSPIVVAQHISAGFDAGLVKWLNRISKLTVKIASEGEMITPGTIYCSPSESHMRINSRRSVVFDERQPGDIYSPSCDTLLSSAAAVYGEKSIGVILTGMGDDGVSGMKKIKEAGGITIAQDEKSSVVFGMPKVAIESGCIDNILPLDEISDGIIRFITG